MRTAVIPLLAAALLQPSAANAQRRPELPEGVTHGAVDDIYREALDESAEMAREWFNGCLKD